MISLTCDYRPGAPDDATIRHTTETLSPGTHVSSSQDPKVVESFLAESHDQKLCVPLLPLCQKSQRVENQNFGGHFSRRICLLRPKIYSSAKTGIFPRTSFFNENFHRNIWCKYFSPENRQTACF